MALALAAVISATSMKPVLGEEYEKREGREERGEHERRDEHGRRDVRRRHDERDRREYEPIYAPPPVVYTPAPSPGISIFFPFGF